VTVGGNEDLASSRIPTLPKPDGSAVLRVESPGVRPAMLALLEDVKNPNVCMACRSRALLPKDSTNLMHSGTQTTRPLTSYRALRSWRMPCVFFGYGSRGVVPKKKEMGGDHRGGSREDCAAHRSREGGNGYLKYGWPTSTTAKPALLGYFSPRIYKERRVVVSGSDGKCAARTRALDHRSAPRSAHGPGGAPWTCHTNHAEYEKLHGCKRHRGLPDWEPCPQRDPVAGHLGFENYRRKNRGKGCREAGDFAGSRAVGSKRKATVNRCDCVAIVDPPGASVSRGTGQRCLRHAKITRLAEGAKRDDAPKHVEMRNQVQGGCGAVDFAGLGLELVSVRRRGGNGCRNAGKIYVVLDGREGSPRFGKWRRARAARLRTVLIPAVAAPRNP